MQLMLLQKFHLELKATHLCSKFGSDLDLLSSIVDSVVRLSSSNLALCLSPTRVVRVEFSGCMKNVFKPLLMMKVAGTIFGFSLSLKRMGSLKPKSAIAGSLTLASQ